MKKTTRTIKKVQTRKVNKDKPLNDPDFFKFDDEYQKVETYKATPIKTDTKGEKKIRKQIITTKTTYKVENNDNKDEILIKEEKKDYSRLLRILNKIARICLNITIVVSLLIILDLFLISRFEIGPIFAIRTETYDDGGTKEYYGLGYKVIKYKVLNGREGTVLGGYSLKYSDTPKKIDLSKLTKKKVDKLENKDFVEITGTVKKIDKKNKRVVLKDGNNTVYCDIRDSYRLDKIAVGHKAKIMGNMYIEESSSKITLYIEKGVVN